MTTTVVILLLQVLVQFGPEVYQEAVNLFKKPIPTPADFDKLTEIINKPLHS